MKILREANDDIEHMSSEELKRLGYEYDPDSGNFVRKGDKEVSGQNSKKLKSPYDDREEENSQKESQSTSDYMVDKIEDAFDSGEYPQNIKKLNLNVDNIFKLWLQGK